MSKSIANIEVDENKFNSTNETENLHLPQFVATDKPGWLTDFNGAMEVIDEAAGVLQDQITEQFEDLESVHTQLDRVDDDINNPEHGLKQLHADNSNRISRLETTVGNESHGLVKDVADLQEDMVQTNTMAVKDNAALGSVVNLLCNKFITTAQYNPGAYVYTVNDDGSLNFLRCTTIHRGAFNPDHFEDVTEKLITALDNSGGGSGSQYVLPVAGDADDPDAVLGGVIVGEGLSIDPETGVLSRTVTPTEGIGPDYYASRVRAGLVKPNTDAGLDVNSSNGVISIIIDDNTMTFTQDGKLAAKPDTSRFASGQGISISSEAVPHVSVKLADNSNLGFDSEGGLRAILPDSSYTIVQGSGVEIVTDAQNNTKTINIKQASPNELGGIMTTPDEFYIEHTDEDHPNNVEGRLHLQLYENKGLKHQPSQGFYVGVDGTTVTYDQNGNLQASGGGSYTLPIASSSTLGGIKVGSGLSIENDGTLNASGGGSVEVDNKTIAKDSNDVIGVKETTKSITRVASPDYTGASLYQYSLPGLDRLDYDGTTIGQGDTLGLYISNATAWNKYDGCTFTFTNPNQFSYPGGSFNGVPLYVLNAQDKPVKVATLYAGVSYRICGPYNKMVWAPNAPEVAIKAATFNLISPNKYNDIEKVGIAATAQNLISATNAIIPSRSLSMYGNPDMDVPSGTSLVAPAFANQAIHGIISVHDSCKYRPLQLYIPMYFRPGSGFYQNVKDWKSDVWDLDGSGNPMHGYSAEITYRVDLISDPYTFIANSPTRHTIFTKTYRVRRSMFTNWLSNLEDPNTGYDYVPVRDYLYGRGNDPVEYRYLPVDIYPSDATRLVVTASIMFEDVNTGGTHTLYSEVITQDEQQQYVYNGDFELGWVEMDATDQFGNAWPADYGTPENPGQGRMATLKYYLYRTDNF